MDRIVRIPEAVKLMGLSRSTIYRRQAEPGFPRLLKLGERACGFRLSDIQRFIDSIGD